MIEESVQNSRNGVQIAAEVGRVLGEITATSGKVSALISEIAAASREQSLGIGQVNTAIAQIDKVTQSAAASAEESASASEEMAAQSLQMKSVVEELMALVGIADPATPAAVAPVQAKAVTPAPYRRGPSRAIVGTRNDSGFEDFNLKDAA